MKEITLLAWQLWALSAMWLATGLWWGFHIGCRFERDDMKQQAIQHNAALWEVDQSGSVKFQWKDEQ